MERVIAASALLALVPVVWWLMLRGWRGRLRDQAAGLELPEPEPAPTGLAWVADPPVGAVYVSTTLAGQPFERVLVHDLGARSSARLLVLDEGLLVGRDGARSFLVPRGDVVGVERRRGQVGKFVAGRGGLVVLTWRLGEAELDTALHCRRREDADALAASVAALVGSSPQPPGAGGAA